MNIMHCPVDFIAINENKARLTAFFVWALIIAYLISGFWLIMFFLMVDFGLRVFNLGKFSLLGFLSDAVIKQLKIKHKPTDRAPKRFAAGVGLFFTIAILAAFFTGLDILAYVLAVVMAFFAFLESFFTFCAGCYVYDFGKRVNLFR